MTESKMIMMGATRIDQAEALAFSLSESLKGAGALAKYDPMLLANTLCRLILLVKDDNSPRADTIRGIVEYWEVEVYKLGNRQSETGGKV